MAKCLCAEHAFSINHVIPKSQGHYSTQKIILIRQRCFGRHPPLYAAGDPIECFVNSQHPPNVVNSERNSIFGGLLNTM